MGKTAHFSADQRQTKMLNPPVVDTDVLYLTNMRYIPAEVKQLLRRNKLSYLQWPIDQFSHIRDRIGVVGTVIIDIDDPAVQPAFGPSRDGIGEQNLARIMEALEMEGIGVILLTNHKKSVRSFSLTPANSSFFQTSLRREFIDIDELWVRISLNLAYRKKTPRQAGITVKPAATVLDARYPLGNRNRESGDEESILSQHRKVSCGEQAFPRAGGANLAEQLRMAGRVQRDFLPAQLPNCDQLQWATLFLPAECVSGDIYDVVRIDEQHFGFYVADAVGHSMPAALLTIFIKQALVMRQTYENNYKIFSPAEVIKNLNNRMTGPADGGPNGGSGYQFATCCYCLLNIKTLQLTFARAGHPYPILIRPGQPPVQLELRGTLLGVFENAEYIQQTIQLAHGDKFVLYSDGAEPFIGRFEDLSGFHFKNQFCEIAPLPIVEMMDRLNRLVHNSDLSDAEVDDITAFGLQIL